MSQGMKEHVDGIILILSCQKYERTRLQKCKLQKPYYGKWKVIYVIGDLFLSDDFILEGHRLLVKCEDSYIHLFKKLTLAIKHLYVNHDIKEGILRCGDDILFNEDVLTSFLNRSDKEDFIGKCGGRSVHSTEITDSMLKTTVFDPFMVNYYRSHVEDFTNPHHNLLGVDISRYKKRPLLANFAIGVIFYISNRACRCLVQKMEDIDFNVFHYDDFSQSYPYTIEDRAVTYILYSNRISFTHDDNMFSDHASSSTIGFHTNAFKTNDVGFIMLRCVDSELSNQYWKHNYKCIRKFYPLNEIMIIDDNSDPTFLKETDFKMEHVTIVKSEYQSRGVLLMYIYYLKFPFCETAVLIHDSSFVNNFIDFSLDAGASYSFLWQFEHHWDQIDDETRMIKIFQNTDLLRFYENKAKKTQTGKKTQTQLFIALVLLRRLQS